MSMATLWARYKKRWGILLGSPNRYTVYSSSETIFRIGWPVANAGKSGEAMKISRLAVDRLMKIKWLNSVGKPTLLSSVRQVKNDNDFIVHINSMQWENTTLEAGNKISGFLARSYFNLYHNWNPLVREAKNILGNEIIPITSSVLISNEMVINNIKWDLVNYLLEDAYKDKLRFKLFFDELVNVYESGHIPCGWDGEWPEGNLVIY